MQEYLDYDGLKHYHEKLKEEFKSNGLDDVSLAKRVETLEIDVELLKTGMAYISVLVETEDETAIQGVKISGLLNSDKTAKIAFTDQNGIASGYINPGSSYTLSISNMLDISDASLQVKSPVAGNKYAMDWVVTPSPYKRVTSTGEYYMSSYYSAYNYEIVGGGGGGSAYSCRYTTRYEYIYGAGGGGGETITGFSDTILTNTPFQITIGSGGWGASSYDYRDDLVYTKGAGSNGGATTAFGKTASGGNGGGSGAITSGNQKDTQYGGASINGGKGGSSGSVGQNGTVLYHDSETTTALAAGGGGGANSMSTGSAISGGQSCGGAGGVARGAVNASRGRSPGGGGGGASSTGTSAPYETGSAGSGGSGGVFLLFSK